MNIDEIKAAGMRLSLEAAVSEQLRQLETAYKSGKYAAAWQNADNVEKLLKELVNITPTEQ
jgi:vacuolar-type H+-ATPase subunit I/STV1